MISRKSQTSLEFVLIISLVFFVMLIALYLVSDLVFKTSDDVRNTQMNEIGQTLIDEAREIHYLGLFSEEIISVNLPDGITTMGTITYNGNEHYFFATMDIQGDKINYTYAAEAPLVTESCSEYNCMAGVPCIVCSFDPADYSSGRKDFKLESALYKGGYAVNITRAII